MREKFNPLFKLLPQGLILLTGTNAIGLRADALVPCFLLAIWTILS
jgi:hypothetical protein